MNVFDPDGWSSVPMGGFSDWFSIHPACSGNAHGIGMPCDGLRGNACAFQCYPPQHSALFLREFSPLKRRDTSRFAPDAACTPPGQEAAGSDAGGPGTTRSRACWPELGSGRERRMRTPTATRWRRWAPNSAAHPESTTTTGGITTRKRLRACWPGWGSRMNTHTGCTPSDNFEGTARKAARVAGRRVGTNGADRR